MRYLRQFLWIIGFTLVGEALHALLPLPVPAAVWGWCCCSSPWRAAS